jgi:tetratricopeptide (TPR) repeat protein
MPPCRARAPLLAAVALGLAACAAPRQPWSDVNRPEVLVDVLPRAAELAVDGVALGPGPRTVAVPDPGHRYRFTAALPGFVTAEREEDGARLASARIALVLRPEGFGSARRLDLEDGEGLAAAAALLERGGAHGPALEYAERAVEVEPTAPRAQRALGDAALALGRRSRAVEAYSAYLRLAPGAPDAGEVAQRVELLRRDLTIDTSERRP